jgi:hypothetical protein
MINTGCVEYCADCMSLLCNAVASRSNGCGVRYIRTCIRVGSKHAPDDMDDDVEAVFEQLYRQSTCHEEDNAKDSNT